MTIRIEHPTFSLEIPAVKQVAAELQKIFSQHQAIVQSIAETIRQATVRHG